MTRVITGHALPLSLSLRACWSGQTGGGYKSYVEEDTYHMRRVRPYREVYSINVSKRGIAADSLVHPVREFAVFV